MLVLKKLAAKVIDEFQILNFYRPNNKISGQNRTRSWIFCTSNENCSI